MAKFPYLRNKVKKIESMPFFLPTLIKIATLLYTVPKNCNCKWSFLKFTGPKLPMKLDRHAMVQLGIGQAIIGGFSHGYGIQAKIHLLNCMNRNCSISTLNQELSVPRYWFLALPIPDTITGCISQGKKCQKKVPDSFVILNLFSPKFFQIASWLHL